MRDKSRSLVSPAIPVWSWRGSFCGTPQSIFRFSSAETFTSWYKLRAPHEQWLPEAVYGIPELYGEQIKGARLIANAGCYATSVILALRPLKDAGWVATASGVVADCKSGASGAGKEPRRDLHFV